jgi:hypothetical protein
MQYGNLAFNKVIDERTVLKCEPTMTRYLPLAHLHRPERVNRGLGRPGPLFLDIFIIISFRSESGGKEDILKGDEGQIEEKAVGGGAPHATLDVLNT